MHAIQRSWQIPCILMYYFTASLCTHVLVWKSWPLYRNLIVIHQFIRKYFCSHVGCVCFVRFNFSVSVLLYFLSVTNLRINREDVSCLLTCAHITSRFFWFIFVFMSQIIWLGSSISSIYIFFHSRKWTIFGLSPMGHHFLTPWCHIRKTALSLKQFGLWDLWQLKVFFSV